ncbi:MAG: avidin/streptavidin family protein [Sulfuricellaceae bacterium]|nr:avidin/streptavidin family protein [Sulfuricellaceae bacterium]
MKNIFYTFCTLFLFMSGGALAGSADQPAVQALSAWTNQSGSTLYIDAVNPSTGQLSGHYINRAQGYNCQNISYPVTGWIYGTAITFTTIWQSTTESCNSITAWTGFYYKGQISTLWQLVINGSTSTGQIMQGSDVFTRNTTSDKKSLLREK